ncbi:MAG: DUF4124 domain-containing protein [Zoogloeaceae bacterium]|jgi:hypothetical protein|nr:DUF4124 domain-containing protein [Zoogloeaceae bacterium]
MKTRLIPSFFLFLMLAVLPAQAEVYKWKDGKGNTVISDTPQPGSGQPLPPTGDAGAPTAVPAAGANQPKSLADQELEFRKRLQEKQAAESKAEKEKLAATEKRERCERAKKAQATLQSSRSLRTLDGDGTRIRYDAAQRQKELESARRIVEQSCN